MELQLDNNSFLPLRDVVFQTLRSAIIRGDFEPGERLMEVKLANKLGVSRTPVREAIRMLELEGLVVMVPRRGAEVARITLKDLKDSLEVRLAIEELAVTLACDRITDEQKMQLIQANNAFHTAIINKKVPDIVAQDVNFHDVIFQITGNQRLISVAQSLREQVYRYRVEYVKDFTYHDVLVKEHDEITKAVVERNKEAAIEIMRKHIYNQELIVIQNLQEQESEKKRKKRK